VQAIFFRRRPDAALAFSADALRRGAVHFPALRAAALAAAAATAADAQEESGIGDPESYDDAAARAFAEAIRAFERQRSGTATDAEAHPATAHGVLHALGCLDQAARSLARAEAAQLISDRSDHDSDHDSDDHSDDDSDHDGPLASAERQAQSASFEALFRADGALP
jgi:hypothetical protein